MKYKENGTKNLRHIWSVLCSSSVLDQDTNNLSLNNVVEQLNVDISEEDLRKKEAEKSEGFAVNVQLQLVTRIAKKIQNKSMVVNLKFDILNPESKVVGSMTTGDIAMKKELKNLRFRNNIPTLPIDKDGVYTIAVLLKEAGESQFTEVDRVPLDVIVKIKK